MKKLKTKNWDAQKKWSNHKVCGVSPEAWKESMVGKMCERGSFWAGNEIEREWNEVDRVNSGVDSRDRVKHIERNDHLYTMKMIFIAEMVLVAE